MPAKGWRANPDERFNSKIIPEPNSGCLLWDAGVSEDGYGHFWFEGKTVKASRYAWEREHGPIPDGLQICHICDTPPCVNTSHMFLGTVKDNARDRERKGRANRPFGESHPHSKLSESVVLEIRKARREGKTQVSLAKKYGISEAVVSVVVNNTSWTHVS